MDAAGVQVMPLDRQGAGVYGEVTSGEDILPFPGFFGPGVFAGQGRRHGDGDLGVGVPPFVRAGCGQRTRSR